MKMKVKFMMLCGITAMFTAWSCEKADIGSGDVTGDRTHAF